MPSVVGLLEQRELVARRRVDELREEADRIQAELTLAERDWKEWAIARSRVGEVLDPAEEAEQGHDQVGRTAPSAGGRAEQTSSAAGAAKPRSQVPVWREGLAWSVLSVDYQRILEALGDRHRLHQGPLTCQELAVMFGLDAVPAKVEALRSKAKRLVARGWLAERQPGRFTLGQGPAGQGGAS
ncbi:MULTISPECIES: hypothetical protein [unclassified Streptomyces]|uniref:hypothetical protein n=1 Tax=unclassified Streptomyces TaxID=2593676 RepID=UPI000C27EE45|nr:hypothetical protein [Streptomyces sp. CB02959]PJN35872.1 hypothetical protein CG747_36760 [Streptomyces sp. CB02959]